MPLNRILSESDVPSQTDVKLGVTGSIAYIAAVRNISVHNAAKITAENGLRLLKAVTTK